MRTGLIICMLVAVCNLSLTNRVRTDSSINILEAVANNLISITITGKGGYSGNNLAAVIKNKSVRKVTVIIPAGIVCKPTDESMQDLLLVKTYTIELKPSESKPLQIDGFCSVARKKSPANEMKFSLEKSLNTKLEELATYLDKHRFDSDAIQSAVWCVSDNYSISDIYSERPDSVSALRKEVARLTGQKDDWYMVKTNRTVNDEGYINREPVLVTGDITLSNNNPAPLKQEVCKENGVVVWTSPKSVQLPKSPNISYNFKLKVEGWERGKYFVRVSVPGRVILKQEFVI